MQNNNKTDAAQAVINICTLHRQRNYVQPDKWIIYYGRQILTPSSMQNTSKSETTIAATSDVT
eukprot:m.304389 g.304389  ORF g.304389 m.304389 type:complete len:63 (+) comp16825_c0_seq1:73-261(+)